MLRGEVFGFGGIVFEIEEGERGFGSRELAGLATATDGLGFEILVREMEFPRAAADGLQMIVPIEIQRVVR